MKSYYFFIYSNTYAVDIEPYSWKQKKQAIEFIESKNLEGTLFCVNERGTFKVKDFKKCTTQTM